MESISKSPQPAVGLCSGNMKQLSKQASAVHRSSSVALGVLQEDFCVRKCPISNSMVSDIIQNNS